MEGDKLNARATRVSLSLLASACLTFALASCDSVNQLQGPVAARLDEDGIVVVLCRATDVTAVTAKTEVDGDWLTFWEAKGEPLSLQRGDEITTAGLVELFSDIEKLDEPDIDVATGLTVTLIATSHDQNVVAWLDPTLLTGSEWLHPDDTLTREPCV
jgi:hypothetical protein